MPLRDQRPPYSNPHGVNCWINQTVFLLFSVFREELALPLPPLTCSQVGTLIFILMWMLVMRDAIFLPEPLLLQPWVSEGMRAGILSVKPWKYPNQVGAETSAEILLSGLRARP